MPPPVVIPLVVNAVELAARSAQALGLTNAALAEVAQCSVRTVSRWWAKESRPNYTVFQALARVAFATDPALAAELAKAGGVSLEQLGLVVPRVAAPPAVIARELPAPPVVPARLLAEAVVCCGASCGPRFGARARWG
jgi:hypothetical protein